MSRDDRKLDAEYKNYLLLLKDQIVKLHDETEGKICAEWIQRFNGCHPAEKRGRNQLTMLLIDQLREDNLNYPFIFLKNLERHFGALVDDLCNPVSDGQSPPTTRNEPSSDQLLDKLGNLSKLLADADTLNLETEVDLKAIRRGAGSDPLFQHLNSTIREQGATIENLMVQSNYQQLLISELKSLLMERIPEAIRTPTLSPTRSGSQLRPSDSDWIESAVQRINAEIKVLRNSSNRAANAATGGRTTRGLDWEWGDLEEFYERKFARLYADYFLKHHAEQIRVKSVAGMQQIEQSTKFAKHFRQRQADRI